MSIKRFIIKLENQRAGILERIMAISVMFPGAYKEVYRKCGRMNCWCAQDEKGHILKRITWTENGVARSKAVADSYRDDVIAATENYRDFKRQLIELHQVEKQISQSLEALGEQVVKQSREEKNIGSE